MITKLARATKTVVFCLSLLTLCFAQTAPGCGPPSAIREAAPEEIRTFFKGKGLQVLTFLGYSGAGYENMELMIEQATRILEQFDPEKTMVNIGATPEGIGAVYEVAKRKGFTTAGIVSTQAKAANVTRLPALTSCSTCATPPGAGSFPAPKPCPLPRQQWWKTVMW